MMSKQNELSILGLDVQEYDKEKSIENAKKALSKYRDCLMRTDDDYISSLVPSYSDNKSFNNQFHSTVENAVELKEEDTRYIFNILKAFERMPDDEKRTVIDCRYIRRNALRIQDIRNKLRCGTSTYNYIHQEALYKFAICANITVKAN